MKFIVWINEGDGPLTEKQAQRIAREIREDFRIKTLVRPVGGDHPDLLERIKVVFDPKTGGIDGEATDAYNARVRKVFSWERNLPPV